MNQMKNLNFNWLSGIGMILFLYPLQPLQAQCTPSLGTAADFSIFSSIGAITNVGVSTIEGNIGTNQGAVTGFGTSSVSGTTFIADAVTQQAALDLAAAYAGFSGMTPTITNHTPAFGSGETIVSGVYAISTAGSIAGTLILDAQNNPSAKFILKFGGAFTSGTFATTQLINGAQANNIYWIVEGAFSLAANSTLSGTVIANGAISIGVNNELNCKLLSINGAIDTYETLLSITGITNSSIVYYADTDLDGFGDPTTATCYMLSGYVTNQTDCNDTNAQIHPNAIEIYGNGIDDNCNGTTDTDTTICGNTTTWNGSSWNNGIPTFGNAVIFSGNFTSTADLYACSILVTNNATVTCNNNVFVYNEITTNTGSTFTMNNNNNILQVNALAVNAGNVSILRNTSTIVRLDHTLWSAPVTGQNIYNFSPETLTHRFYTYDTTTDTYLSSTLSNTSEFIPTKGYAVRAANNQSATIPAEWTGAFTGVPNNGTYPFNLTHTTVNKFNLVGNPYPSTMNATTFVNDNAATIEGTLYFYAHTLTMDVNGIFPTGTNYASWNATGGTAATAVALNSPNYHTPAVVPNGSIQVGQGFFTIAKNNGVVTFTNAQRINNQDHQFLRTAEENHRIWLNLTSTDDADMNQILIGYTNEATMGVDSNYDGISYGNLGNFLYSIIDDEKYVIQGRALPFSITDEVPLGWYCETAGTYKIKLSNWDGIFQDNQDVFIKDNTTGTTTSIKTTPYTFSSSTGTFNNRFSIVYEPSLKEITPEMNQNMVIAFKKDHTVQVTSIHKIMKDILVYDLTGRLLHQYKNINTNTVALSEITQANQVLLFKISFTDNQFYNLKVLN
jgi:hypothetical protein